MAAATVSRANLTGTVYENDAAYSTDADLGPAFDPGYYASLPSANFTSPAIDYQSQSSPDGYSVGGFLNNPTFFDQANGFDPTLSADNMFITFSGTIDLLAGANSFVVAHDDGIVINIAGIGNAIDQPGPTGENFSPFTVTAPHAGAYEVTVDYTECCGPPADLVWTVNSNPITVGTPDRASTFALLGLAMLGTAIAARRVKLARV